MIVLADKGDEQNVIEEEKEEWLHEVLQALGVPVKAFDLDSNDFRQYLSNMNIEIWSNPEGELDIYQGETIIAQWKTPKFVLVKDKPKWFYEIHLNAWARPLQKLDI